MRGEGGDLVCIYNLGGISSESEISISEFSISEASLFNEEVDKFSSDSKLVNWSLKFDILNFPTDRVNQLPHSHKLYISLLHANVLILIKGEVMVILLQLAWNGLKSHKPILKMEGFSER